MSSIYSHFASYTKLPVKIDDVCEQAKEDGGADKFLFVDVDIDTLILRGFLRMYEEITAYSDPPKVAEIFYSSQIHDKPTIRMVCCKEILHTLDNSNEVATSREAVEELIDSIIIPPGLDIEIPTSALSDHVGMLKALLVLLPRDALAELRPKYEAGDLSVEDVARLAAIPTAYARIALSPLWEKVLERID